MTYVSNKQGIQIPTKDDSPGYLAEFIEDAVLSLEDKVVMRFANATARDAALSGSDSPVIGEVCVLTDTLTYYKFNGSAWAKLFPTITVSTSDPSGGVTGDIWLKI